MLWSALSLLLIANIINAGADIGAIAAGVHLLVPQIGEIWMILPITIVLTASLIFLSYKTIANVFKWLTLSLFAYVATAFFCHLDAAIVLKDTLLSQQARPQKRSSLCSVVGQRYYLPPAL
ncbi:MAG: divalent metal cation transporter [Candidatus Obscuribacter sp.]|nr:divalent metal cation transporter [Candidatus Obscuribacter sp.]MBK9774522.1 divalent metal cation transporter [Candidatus Obscuribacter sp.]